MRAIPHVGHYSHCLAPPKVVGHPGVAAEALKDLLAKALWVTSGNGSKPTRGYRDLTDTRLKAVARLSHVRTASVSLA